MSRNVSAKSLANLRRGGPGRHKGSRNRLSVTSLREMFAELEQQHPDLLKTTLIRGLQARPPASFPYLQLCVHYLVGKPKDVLAVEGTVTIEDKRAVLEHLPDDVVQAILARHIIDVDPNAEKMN